MTFHHDPAHDDTTIDRLLAEAGPATAHPFAVVPGTEGLSLDLGAPPRARAGGPRSAS